MNTVKFEDVRMNADAAINMLQELVQATAEPEIRPSRNVRKFEIRRDRRMERQSFKTMIKWLEEAAL